MSESTGPAADVAEIERIVDVFFGAFVSGPEAAGRLAALHELFLPEAVVVATCGQPPRVYDVDGFIAPRRELLMSGALTDFTEWRGGGRTDVFGDIAHWWGDYGKAGSQEGERFTGRGMKSMQLVRMPQGWRISAAVWDDERDGLSID
ncbi:DUF4440 domain-containing protein [Luteipulveratus halotolerans]|uniref:DUF4440 domain-containing protein n=1 Tax=Luteipulveratus halotolerans TaxID=1631356 RepID=A0A0L6CFE9_9MICO|nr:DUF4440 domain-containing protein [Luteipulveratus halotolerans]KNX36325.1 hypothetical protein VV01_02920 [Luteipulveratus halotolerans]